MSKSVYFTLILFLCVSLFSLSDAEFNIKGNVKKRNTVIRADNSFLSTCYNSTIFTNANTLRRIVLASKYIFTGKISSVQSRKRGVEKLKRSILKVFVRRVLKGDISELSDLLNYKTRTTNSSNRVTLLVEGGPWNKLCAAKGPAILFGESLSAPLKLLVDPVPLSFDRVRKVKKAIKGMFK
ncbi:unnamed protein product [Euphydryas editha]|uniref:Uncharacterized protein n=1 Tax=Euphydryas editha TaxID=104508 RepID=A0AAU9UX23_EUPED|nr:unnamed protein product [Euphydryas editha]